MPVDVAFPLEGKRIWVAGHRGMVGSAIVRRLAKESCRVLTVDREDLDLRDQAATRNWVMNTKPDAIFLTAATVGGILANDTSPANFLYDNLMIAANIVEAAHRAAVPKLLFLGSSCIYPKAAPQPIDEDALLSGPLEPTNAWYAIAKIAGIKLCQAYRKQHGCDFISAMPSNLYGPGDNYDLDTSHVIPALIRKAHEAKLRAGEDVVIWGTGTSRREFLHVDDCADACVRLMESYSAEAQINVGSGEELTILTLAQLVCDVVGFKGAIRYDTAKPDGATSKLMNSDRIRALGWAPQISLRDGVSETYRQYKQSSV